MLTNPAILLSLIVFIPTVGALVLAFIPQHLRDVHRYVALACTIAVFALCAIGLMGPQAPFATRGDEAAYMQKVFNISWIPSFNIDYFMGLDGISFPLIILTAFISFLAMAASWSITKHVKAYCILYLLLVTGMLGVFLSLDFFLFYVFWEVMLLPMYFLIGVWGGPRREYAAIKFFLYTLVGSVLMLIAILILYFNSDVQKLMAQSDVFGSMRGSIASGTQQLLLNPAETSGPVNWNRLHLNERVETRLGIKRGLPTIGSDVLIVRTGGERLDQPVTLRMRTVEGEETSVRSLANNTVDVVVAPGATLAQIADVLQGTEEVALIVPAQRADAELREDVGVTLPAVDRDRPIHTFNLLALTAMGQHTTAFDEQIQFWCFILLFIGFAIKVPSVPLHTWLPDAHVEAPTPISMILAGILLKMGGYGILRICYPICPYGGYELAYYVCAIGVISMVYGAFAALAQTDFKRLVAYSSVSHMGYVVLGLGVWSAQRDLFYNADYWNQGVQGAMFQMIAHGISSAGMFFMVGVVYDRVHHRNLNEFGGLFGKMPVYTAFAIGIFFAGLGLPGLCGFIGEVFVVLSVWKYDAAMAIISAAVVILTAAYILWTLQRVYLGAEYRGPHEDHLTPSTLRENLIAGTLLACAIIFGVFPYRIFNQWPSILAYMEPTVTRQVNELADWTARQTSNGTIAATEAGTSLPLVRFSPDGQPASENAIAQQRDESEVSEQVASHENTRR